MNTKNCKRQLLTSSSIYRLHRLTKLNKSQVDDNLVLNFFIHFLILVLLNLLKVVNNVE